jgi:hypothetical protein
MVFCASRLGLRRLLAADVVAPTLPRGPDAEREAGSSHARMVLLLAHAPNAGVKRSFPLVVLLPPRAVPSAADTPISPQRLLPVDG